MVFDGNNMSKIIFYKIKISFIFVKLVLGILTEGLLSYFGMAESNSGEIIGTLPRYLLFSHCRSKDDEFKTSRGTCAEKLHQMGWHVLGMIKTRHVWNVSAHTRLFK